MANNLLVGVVELQKTNRPISHDMHAAESV